MKEERNNLFNYSGLDLLLNRYVIQTHDHMKDVYKRQERCRQAGYTLAASGII